MCAGLALFRDMREYRVYFPDPRARLLCRRKTGEEIEAVWGRRDRREYPGSPLPVTGWARLESIRAGRWDRFQAERVYIPAMAYMEKDREANAHWFHLEDDQFLVGLSVSWRDLWFVYLVTVPTPDAYRHIHHRWVMIRRLAGVNK